MRAVLGDVPEVRSAVADASAGMTRRDFMSGTVATAVSAAVVGVGNAGRAEATPATPIYRIHPAIGIARLGNLGPDAGFIVGPEIPGAGPTEGLTGHEVAQFKVNGLIKPQAARFRVFEYRWINGVLTPVGEVLAGAGGVQAINWTVHLANRKASFYVEDGPFGEAAPAGDLRNPAAADRNALESDFGPRTISGMNAVPQPFTPTTSPVNYPTRQVYGPFGAPVIDYLGQLRTDSAGRVLVFGGEGRSASSLSPPQPLTHWSNNNFWFDDIADGPVTATVTIDDTVVPMDAAGGAWVLVAPPDFAPELEAPVSLYDVLYDMAVRSLTIPSNALYGSGGPLARLAQLNAAWNATPGAFEFGSIRADYDTEIWPIVINAVNLVYTTGLVDFKHGSMLTDPLGVPGAEGDKARGVFFNYLRAPQDAATPTNGPATMPRLYGDQWFVGNELFVWTFGQNGNGNAGGGAVQGQGPRSVPTYVRYSTLTQTQYALLHSWSAGNFIPMSGNPPPPGSITPHGLDRANLEHCIGAPVYAANEGGWQMRNHVLFIEALRLNLHALSQYRRPDGNVEGTPILPGHFSRQMALPWQADFNDCSKLNNLGLWPTARPDDVFLNAGDKLNQRVPWARPDTKWPSGSFSAGFDDMAANWYKFGFVLEESPGVYIEMERNSHVP